MKFFSTILTIAAAIFLANCDLINPPEKIPAYIHIDSFTVKANYDSFGSSSHNITDAWIVLDDQVLGAYELPATIPILEDGTAKITIRAGIKENGISNTRTAYPFYTAVILDHLFVPTKTDTINPVISYSGTKVNYLMMEDFESSSIIFEPGIKSSAVLKRTNDTSLVFEGDYSYLAVLPAKNDILEIETENLYNIPRGKSVFMELNFKTSIKLVAGIYAVNINESRQLPIVTLNPTSKWKKVYINMGFDITNEPSDYVFRFFLGAVNSGTDTAKVYLDNVKLIHFE